MRFNFSKLYLNKKNIFIFSLLPLLILPFQNCGPSKLSGESQQGVSMNPSLNPDSELTTEPPTNTVETLPLAPNVSPEVLLQKTTLFPMTQTKVSFLPSENLSYSLIFSSLPLPKKHRIWVHFLNPETDSFDFQDDFDPMPEVTAWNGTISLNRSIQIPANAPASKYYVSVGIYDPFTSPNNSANWTAWPIVANNGVNVDAKGRHIAGVVHLSKSLEGEILTINGSTNVSTAQGCLYPDFPVGEVSRMGGCIYSKNLQASANYRASANGTYEIKVMASGSFANNDWPNMDIYVDGLKVGSSKVITKNADDSYLFSTTLTRGEHQIGIEMTTDYYSDAPFEDRNLFIDKIVVTSK